MNMKGEPQCRFRQLGWQNVVDLTGSDNEEEEAEEEEDTMEEAEDESVDGQSGNPFWSLCALTLIA